MSKIVAAINITLDGFCDHTAAIADAELHQHFTELLSSAGTLLYGRTTYQMMESYWPTVLDNPDGKPADEVEFAVAIQNVHKIVFSRTLKTVSWQNATVAKGSLKEEVLALRQQAGNDVFVGSPSLIAALTDLKLIDEYQLTVHPVIAGSGLPLFKNIREKIILKPIKTKTFRTSGVATLYYETPRAGK